MHEDGLSLVVGGVTEGDGVGFDAVGEVGEEAVADFAGRLLEGGDAMFPLVGDGVGLVDGCGKVQLGGHFGYEGGVVLGFLAAKVVVEMGDVELEMRCRLDGEEGVEKGGGVGAAGAGDDEIRAAGQAGFLQGPEQDEFQFAAGRHGWLAAALVQGFVEGAETPALAVVLEDGERTQVNPDAPQLGEGQAENAQDGGFDG